MCYFVAVLGIPDDHWNTDLQKLNNSQLVSVESLFLSLARSFAVQLGLSVMPNEVWDPLDGPNMNFEGYLRREVLGKLHSNCVWGLDEVDRLFERMKSAIG